jgi:hypothetical protein
MHYGATTLFMKAFSEAQRDAECKRRAGTDALFMARPRERGGNRATPTRDAPVAPRRIIMREEGATVMTFEEIVG